MTATPADPTAFPPVNVLVVDDVVQNLVAMEALLRRDSVNILQAASGAEALELLLTHEVALVLLDVQMPDMDGFAVAELMRGAQRTRDVPIIFLTASPNDPVRSFKGYESGAVDFLHKPIDPRVILGKVNVFVELQQRRLQLKARNEALERALGLNETMVAVLTHDLRTPLAAILASAEVLRLQTRDGPSAPAVARLASSAQRMARMIEQLLDFSRIRADVLHLHARDADLGAVAEAVVGELREALPGSTIELARDGALAGCFDGDRMAQVIANLVGNAVQHGAAGAPVRVALDGADPDGLGVSVTNRGRIPDELLPSIFEPFKSSPGRRGTGLGLGLYIVHAFVSAHGGHVAAANTPDGAVFRVRIPRRHAPAHSAAPR